MVTIRKKRQRAVSIDVGRRHQDQKSGNAFRVRSSFRNNQTKWFQIKKYFEAYGPVAIDPGKALRRPESAHLSIDQNSFAGAFDAIAQIRMPKVVEMLKARKVSKILEIACGSAPISRSYCLEVPSANAVCCDSSRPMCLLAEKWIERDGLRDRVKVIECDHEVILGEDTSFDCVCVRGFLNSLIWNGASKFLSRIKGA